MEHASYMLHEAVERLHSKQDSLSMNYRGIEVRLESRQSQPHGYKKLQKALPVVRFCSVWDSCNLNMADEVLTLEYAGSHQDTQIQHLSYATICPVTSAYGSLQT